MLKNHGILAVGSTAAEAWIGIYFLQKACQQQVMALSIGRDKVLLAPEASREEVRQQTVGMPMVAGLAWPGLLRQLDRRSCRGTTARLLLPRRPAAVRGRWRGAQRRDGGGPKPRASCLGPCAPSVIRPMAG